MYTHFKTLGAFESFVNSDRCKANKADYRKLLKFESFVNSDRCKANQS